MAHQYLSFSRPVDRKQQEFSPLVDEYYLDRNGILQVKPVQRDQQAMIESVEYTKLDEIYDAFLNSGLGSPQFVIDGLIQEREDYFSELDLLNSVDQLFDSYKQEYGIKGDLSKAELYGLIKERAETAQNEIKLKWSEFNETQKTQSSTLKQESEQKEFHPDSTESARQELA